MNREIIWRFPEIGLPHVSPCYPTSLIYNGTSYQNGWFGGSHILGNLHILKRQKKVGQLQQFIGDCHVLVIPSKTSLDSIETHSNIVKPWNLSSKYNVLWELVCHKFAQNYWWRKVDKHGGTLLFSPTQQCQREICESYLKFNALAERNSTCNIVLPGGISQKSYRFAS